MRRALNYEVEGVEEEGKLLKRGQVLHKGEGCYKKVTLN